MASDKSLRFFEALTKYINEKVAYEIAQHYSQAHDETGYSWPVFTNLDNAEKELEETFNEFAEFI